MGLARRVAVVGGGWAGLAAAVEARSRGFDVTLYEMSPHWGGRARQVEIDGLDVDNGQHIMIGAYVETLRLMSHVGVDPDEAFLRTPLRLCTPDGRGLSLPEGAPVLSFLRGVLGHGDWRLADRGRVIAIAGLWAAGGFRCRDDLTVRALTSSVPLQVRTELIEPLCVAALNTPAADASAAVFLRVLRDALFSGRGSADLLLPRRRLSDLFPLPAVAWLQRNGAILRPRTRVATLERIDGGWVLEGERFGHVIVAATAAEASRLVRDASPRWSDSAASLIYEPIVTVYARSAGARLPQPMLALSSNDRECPAQFVFDLGQLGTAEGTMAFVISGARRWLERGLEDTSAHTLAQGRTALAQHLHSPLELLRVMTEKRATFRCTPALVRPGGRIAPGLYAAGDYVDGPYPATIEGAVRSALQAVQSLGRPPR